MELPETGLRGAGFDFDWPTTTTRYPLYQLNHVKITNSWHLLPPSLPMDPTTKDKQARTDLLCPLFSQTMQMHYVASNIRRHIGFDIYPSLIFLVASWFKTWYLKSCKSCWLDLKMASAKENCTCICKVAPHWGPISLVNSLGSIWSPCWPPCKLKWKDNCWKCVV